MRARRSNRRERSSDRGSSLAPELAALLVTPLAHRRHSDSYRPFPCLLGRAETQPGREWGELQFPLFAPAKVWLEAD